MTVDRRTFLLGSGAAMAAVAGGSLVSAGPADAAAAALPIGGHDHRLFGATSLPYARSGWQSFAWGSHDKRFFYVQPCPSPGRGTGITDAKEHGDLRLSTVTASGHTSSSHMQLTGFGHGGTMGVEATASHSYVWLGCDGSPYRAHHNSASNAIACFRWVPAGKPYTSAQIAALPHSARYVLKAHSTGNQVTFDESTRRIALRYTTGSGSYYAVYDADQVRAHGSRAVPVRGLDAIPAAHVEAGGHGSFQSFALRGDHLYALRGTKGKNDATLSAYTLSTKAVTARPFTAAAGSRGREPEGLCVAPVGSTARLCVGVKNDASAAHHQTSAVFYKT